MKAVRLMNNENKSIFAPDNPIGTTGKRQDKTGKKGSTVYAGGLNLMDDKITQKRMQARKQAAKLVTDQFENDAKIGNDIKKRYERIKELQSEMGAVSDEISYINEEQAKLKDVYGITEDSQEQKDLELLQKDEAGETLTPEEEARLQDMKLLEKNRSGGLLTPAEKERLKSLEPLTEYQQRMLDYEDQKQTLTQKKEKLYEGIMNESNAITATKNALLKVPAYKGMGGALDNADAIMEAAAKEIMGMLVEEGKEYVDEKLEEVVENAEEKAEEKKEEEEKLEEIKEEKEQNAPEAAAEESAETVEKLPELENEQNKVETEIKKIMEEQALLEEDLKGLVVNETL